MTPEDLPHVLNQFDERLKLLEKDAALYHGYVDQCIEAVRRLIDQVNTLADRLNGHLADQKEAAAPARPTTPDLWDLP